MVTEVWLFLPKVIVSNFNAGDFIRRLIIVRLIFIGSVKASCGLLMSTSLIDSEIALDLNPAISAERAV